MTPKEPGKIAPSYGGDLNNNHGMKQQSSLDKNNREHDLPAPKPNYDVINDSWIEVKAFTWAPFNKVSSFIGIFFSTAVALTHARGNRLGLCRAGGWAALDSNRSVQNSSISLRFTRTRPLRN